MFLQAVLIMVKFTALIFLFASLAKNSRKRIGRDKRLALQLIESATVSVPQPTPASSSDERVGSNINITV